MEQAARVPFKGEVYVPLLLEDEDGMAHGTGDASCADHPREA